MTTMTTPQNRPNGGANGARSPSRMILSAVTRGRVSAPLRVLCYGVEGVGKSTLGANAPSPIFLGAEDGSALLDVARFPQPRSFQDVLDAIGTLIRDDHEFKTLVVDSLDWVEPLVWSAVCATAGIESIESLSYGKGYLAAVELWRKMIAALDALRRAKQMHIVLIGHALCKKFSNPEGFDYERYTLKLNDKAAALWREWVDELLFARFEEYAVKGKDDKRAKGVSTGVRVAHTIRAAAFDAKTRHGLRDPIPLSWDEIERGCFAGTEAMLDAARSEATELLKSVPEESRAKTEEWLRACWDNRDALAQRVNQAREKLGEREAQSKTTKNTND